MELASHIVGNDTQVFDCRRRMCVCIAPDLGHINRLNYISRNSKCSVEGVQS
jgi:hypothetical protein